MPEFLVNRVLFLHSPSVLYAALPKLTSGFKSDGECLNSSFSGYWICIRLSFCTLSLPKLT